MLELLTGALAGGLFSFEVFQHEKTGLDPDSSKLFIALDVQAFVEQERFTQRIDDLLAWLRDAEPGLTIVYPGERGWQTRDQNLRDGVPIHREIVEQLRAGGVMLSHYSAYKVAESFRVLETLFPGRIDLGLGRAPGSDQRTALALAQPDGAHGVDRYPDAASYRPGDIL